MENTLLSLGHGYCAQALARRLLPQGWTVLGTTRDPAKAESLRAQGVTPVLWQPEAVTEALADASHVLVSAGPQDGDPSLALVGDAIAARAPELT